MASGKQRFYEQALWKAPIRSLVFVRVLLANFPVQNSESPWYNAQFEAILIVTALGKPQLANTFWGRKTPETQSSTWANSTETEAQAVHAIPTTQWGACVDLAMSSRVSGEHLEGTPRPSSKNFRRFVSARSLPVPDSASRKTVTASPSLFLEMS
jgi:hypothetical protein